MWQKPVARENDPYFKIGQKGKRSPDWVGKNNKKYGKAVRTLGKWYGTRRFETPGRAMSEIAHERETVEGTAAGPPPKKKKKKTNPQGRARASETAKGKAKDGKVVDL